MLTALITCLLLRQGIANQENDYYAYWWTYHGFSGPEYWSLYPPWKVCNAGRRQSPINFSPSRLLFDSHLQFVHVDKHRVSGNLSNTGHAITFTADVSSAPPVLISGGPLPYQYTFRMFHLHFGVADRERRGSENVTGSEHRVDGQQFPAEIQLMGFNSHLYDSFDEAVGQPHGIVGIAVLIQISPAGEPNQELRIITDAVKRTKYKDDSTRLAGISPRLLLPNTEQFMTYEGSMTFPGCDETVTWIVFNKPIYMSRQQIYMLQELKSGEKIKKDPPSLANNFRPIQPLHNRVVRTNIDFRAKDQKGCRAMRREMGYKASKWLGV